MHASFPTGPSEWSALAVATDTACRRSCGVDANTGLSACGEAYLLVAGSGIIVKSGSIELTPLEATNPAGTDAHGDGATSTSGGSPLAGQTVTFTVTGQNAGASGTCVPAGCVTDAFGNVSFTYHDGNGAGEDTIKASFTDADGSLQSATAQKHWAGGAPRQAHRDYRHRCRATSRRLQRSRARRYCGERVSRRPEWRKCGSQRQAKSATRCTPTKNAPKKSPPAGEVEVTSGKVPASSAQMLALGTYYW